MASLTRRSFCSVAACAWLASPATAQRLVLPGGHRRVGRNLKIEGRLVQGMVAIPVMVGGRGPFLFEVATVGHGFAIRSEVAAAMAAKPGPDGTAALPAAFAADLELTRSGPARVLPPGHGLAQPLDGVIGLDAFGDLSLSMDFDSGDLLAGPVSLDEPDGRTIFGYEVHDAPVVPVTVAGTTFPARVATGQIRAPLLVNPALAAQIAASAPEAAGDAFAGGRRFELRRVALQERARIGTTELPVSSAVYPGPSDEASLGALGLTGLVLQIDRRNRRLRVLGRA